MRRITGFTIAFLMTGLWNATPAQAGFMPTDLSGLAIWQDAGKLEEMGLSDGAKVSTWLSSGGLAYGASQSIASFQPTFHTNVINGLPAVHFGGDAVDESLLVLSDPTTQATYGALGIGSNGITYFAVLSATRPDDAELGGPVLGDDNNIAMLRVGSANAVLGRHNFEGWVTAPGNHTDFSRFAGTFSNIDANASNETTLYIDGIALPTTTQTNSGETVAGLTLNIGADVTDNTTRPHFEGDLAELIIYNRRLTPDEIGQVDAYLYSKYVVPEPSSLAMLGTGVAALILGRAVRRRRSSVG